MKFLAISLIYTAAAYAQLDLTPIYCTTARINAANVRCLWEENAVESDITDIIVQRAAQSENAKCFRACILRECQFMDVYGNLVPNIAQGLSDLLGEGDPDKMILIERIVKMCVQSLRYDGNRCQHAEDFAQCLLITCSNNKCNLDLEHL